MSDTPLDIDLVLDTLADDAFVVLNWARRQGFKRDQQLNEVVAAYKKTLAAYGVQIVRRTHNPD